MYLLLYSFLYRLPMAKTPRFNEEIQPKCLSRALPQGVYIEGIVPFSGGMPCGESAVMRSTWGACTGVSDAACQGKSLTCTPPIQRPRPPPAASQRKLAAGCLGDASEPLPLQGHPWQRPNLHKCPALQDGPARLSGESARWRNL
jgi:hypothetical protein